MLTRDFHFDLPEHLIAQHPCEHRSQSRLLHLARDQKKDADIKHLIFKDLPDLIDPGDLLVFNDTRVIPARLYGTKATGGKVEILIERTLDSDRCLAHVRASKTPKAGSMIHIEQTDYEFQVEGRQDDLFVLSFKKGASKEGASSADISIADIMQQAGHMPLPPYIDRSDESIDFERYQTVYARSPGAIAAPTAGLHFDDGVLHDLKGKDINSAFVTLHVGAGTFQPVRVEHIEDHQMHKESIEVSRETVMLCEKTRKQGGRIIAVGTTSVRALESASQNGQLAPFCGETDIFITPGYTFKSVDAMITNFHLSESTLLMLVSAFAGIDPVMDAYQQAIEKKYRFFSYGDAMFIS